ncbi:hypothetical protein AVEN_202244-1 [Araneus ventricosus]|uniref:Uncharacterized protein n=1 Tax=Araneus ventricosus TaxID=182803 RepID=A0A4Y2CMG0_ARAVE|nr:hypothetical protein AVEN_202244-1 [Araneus ventricosus]
MSLPSVKRDARNDRGSRIRPLLSVEKKPLTSRSRKAKRSQPNRGTRIGRWDVMEQQLRAQTPPCSNISTFRDRCLDIWYNLSPVTYQKLVVSMPR